MINKSSWDKLRQKKNLPRCWSKTVVNTRTGDTKLQAKIQAASDVFWDKPAPLFPYTTTLESQRWRSHKKAEFKLEESQKNEINQKRTADE